MEATFEFYISKFNQEAKNYTSESLATTVPGRILKALVEGKKITRESKDYITFKINSNSYSNTGIPLMGYLYSFKKFLKRYVVITAENPRKADIVYGMDKTSTKKLFKNVIEIIEI